MTGRATLEAAVHRLGALVRQGQPAAIAWDMDGTLVDTRPRMLAAVHAYGRTDARLTEVSPSWQETARLLRLDPGRFQQVWQRVFWAYESFDADVENKELAALARLAESLGVQTIIITGRVEELRPVTLRQLEQLGLSPTRVYLKSRIGDRTPAIKAEVIAQLAAEGLQVGAFVTDSPEELEAITTEILASAPGLSLIFVELEGASTPLAEHVHRLPVPFRNGSRMVETPTQLLLSGAPMQFGFEAEYEIDTADALLRLYDPDHDAGVSAQDWQDWTGPQRAQWVYGLFPDPHSEEFDLPLRRSRRCPSLDFLPERIFVDSDGNIEVVSRPLDNLAQLWSQIEQLEQACGPPLLQVTVSVPSSAILQAPNGLASLDGYLAFHHLLDILERMAVGHALYKESSDREVLLPFLHPWLGPMTAGKHRFMRQYLEANARGERLDEKWVRLVDRAFSSFKYITGSAYRPALAGPDRIALEIRDAHRNKALLAARISRHAVSLLSGLEPYAPFANVWAFDSETDYERIPADARRLLEAAFPSRERPEIDEMYSAYDRVALQIYRNFALPLKDYSDVELALGEAPGDPTLAQARATYLERLTRLAQGSPSHEQARRALQGALAAFAEESGLLRRLRSFSGRCLSTEPALEAARRVHAFLPLTRALPPSGWKGTLWQRLERLQRRWPKQVMLRSKAAFQTRFCGPDGGVVSRPLLQLSSDGLAPEETACLRGDYLDAVAHHTLGLRATDRGGLELRFGHTVVAPGGRETEYEPFSTGAGRELVLELSGAESYYVGRQLAAHDPCPEAAGRVSASGWLRHLRVAGDGTTLEERLGLPYPESIETSRQVWERVLGQETACVVEWTRHPLSPERAAGVGLDEALPPERSSLVSGFPPILSDPLPLRARIEALVARWPGHARLVSEVPFVFGKGSQRRTVLLLAPPTEEQAWEVFRQDYLGAVGSDTISFPCRLRAEHLRTRLGTLALALSAEGVRVDFYEPPWKRRRLEPLVELEPAEMRRLRQYVGAVIDDTLGLLGPITLGAGARKAAGRLDDNRPGDAGEHNCTTWITLAPVAESGQNLACLVEMPEAWTSHDNPGWWSMFLTGASRSSRVHTVVYWTEGSLEQASCESGQPIPWDFNPH